MRKAGPDEKRVTFKARLSGGVKTLFKSEDGERFVIWGKASVEVVDKEGDKITGEALKEALPQLLRRKRLSVEHSDQLVGDILESFETDEEVTVEIDGKEYTRSEFPTGVLKFDDEEPALFVAGEVWDDTKQARQTREDIDNGEIDSYSISGEAITSSTQVKDGDVYDKITELDLSAVTLCEEGMNQKAKFGTVVKLGSDDPSSSDRTASSPRIAVAKNDTMSNDNSEDGTDGEDDLLNREDLRSEFKTAAQEALDESDFATMKEVKEYVKEEFGNEDAAMTSDEGGEATYGGAEDEDDEEDEEAEADAEKGPGPDVKAAAAALDMEAKDLSAILEAADDDEEEEEEAEVVDPDEIEDPDDDGEEEVDIDPTEDDDLPPEGGDDEEEKGDVLAELEEAGCPDDLIESVSEYVDGGGDDEPPEEPGEDPGEVPEEEGDDLNLEDDEDEEEDDDSDSDEEDEADEKSGDGDMDSDSGAVGEDDLGGDLSKMDDEEYLTSTAGSAAASMDDEDFEKSFDIEDEDGNADDGEEVTAGNALDTFYKGLGEDIPGDD